MSFTKKFAKQKIRITRPGGTGQGNTTPILKGEIVEVIRFEPDGSAVVWAHSLVGKRKILILPNFFEII